MHLDDVARRARIGRNNRRLATGKPIEQGRLAGIRRAGDSDDKTIPQPLAAPPSASAATILLRNCCAA